jgi:hypothetical protein
MNEKEYIPTKTTSLEQQPQESLLLLGLRYRSNPTYTKFVSQSGSLTMPSQMGFNCSALTRYTGS